MMRCLFLLSFIKYCASIPWIDQKRNDFVVDILNAREKMNTDLENNPNYTMTIRFFIFRVVHLLNHCHTPPPQVEKKSSLMMTTRNTESINFFVHLFLCKKNKTKSRTIWKSKSLTKIRKTWLVLFYVLVHNYYLASIMIML